jgi:hypothetical protein
MNVEVVVVVTAVSLTIIYRWHAANGLQAILDPQTAFEILKKEPNTFDYQSDGYLRVPNVVVVAALTKVAYSKRNACDTRPSKGVCNPKKRTAFDQLSDGSLGVNVAVALTP